MPSSRLLIPFAVLIAIGGISMLTRSARERQPAVANSADAASAWLSTPYALNHFSVTDLNGRPVQSETWRGRVGVVNFWATWCLPCRREIPALIALQDRYKDRLVVVGVIDDSANDDAVRQFASTLNVNYPIVRSTFELSKRFPSVEALPMTVLVAPDGRVAVAYAGELDAAELEKDVRRLLATASGAGVPRG